MVQIILFLVLAIVLAIGIIRGLILGILILIKYIKKIEYNKSLKSLRKTLIFCSLLVVVIVGGVIFSQRISNTPKIKDENGNVVEGSISELVEVELNGRKEWISIRGNNKDNPVLLFLAGGPGGTQLASVRMRLSELEKDFVVVNWEQPGSGKSYYAISQEKLKVETYIEDGHELTKYLSKRFNKDKIYLLGESWGSALGIFLADKYPEDYIAFIGTGQMVDFLETEKIDYQLAMDIAKEKNDIEKLEKLKQNGPPPYEPKDTSLKNMEYINYLNGQMSKNTEIKKGKFGTMDFILESEYGIVDKFNFLIGLYRTFNTVYPQLYGIDLRKDYTKIDVPAYFLIGRQDINAPTKLVEEYYEILEAPKKELVWFENSGHGPWNSETSEFIDKLLEIKNQYE